MKKRNTIYAAILGVFLITVLTTFTRYQNIRIDVPISFTLFTFFNFWLCRKSARAILVLWLSFATLILLHLIAALIDDTLPSFGIPNIIAALLGVFSGFFLGRILKFTTFSLAFTIILFTISICYPIKIYKYWDQCLLLPQWVQL